MSLACWRVAIYPRAGRRTCGTEDVAFRLRADSAVRRVKSGEAEGLVPTCACVQALNGANPAPEYVGTCRRCGACPAAPAAAVVAAIVVGEAVRLAGAGSGRAWRGHEQRAAYREEEEQHGGDSLCEPLRAGRHRFPPLCVGHTDRGCG